MDLEPLKDVQRMIFVYSLQKQFFIDLTLLLSPDHMVHLLVHLEFQIGISSCSSKIDESLCVIEE